jgi:hypothetical protein
MDLGQGHFSKPDMGGPWPDRCCACGALHPADIEGVPYSGTISERVEPYGIEKLNIEGTLPVPVCANALCHKKTRTDVGQNRLLMLFASPQFVAELLELRRHDSYSSGSRWRVSYYTP